MACMVEFALDDCVQGLRRQLARADADLDAFVAADVAASAAAAGAAVDTEDGGGPGSVVNTSPSHLLSTSPSHLTSGDRGLPGTPSPMARVPSFFSCRSRVDLSALDIQGPIAHSNGHGATGYGASRSASASSLYADEAEQSPRVPSHPQLGDPQSVPRPPQSPCMDREWQTQEEGQGGSSFGMSFAQLRARRSHLHLAALAHDEPLDDDDGGGAVTF
jgi:hypothetical protein